MPPSIRLRPGVHAAPVAGGLLVTGRGATCLVPGDAAVLDALWLRMLPVLHRGTDPARLTSRSGLAELIVETLDTAGLLLPADPAWPDEPALEFLASVADEPLEAWHRFRALKVAVVGDGERGPAALAVERALVSFGLPAAHLCADDPDVVVTIDGGAPAGDGVAWLGIASCGDRVVVGPLRTGDGGLSLDDAVAVLGAVPGPTSPVAARLAGGLAAADILAFGAGLAPAYRWRASVVHVDGARVETVPVATPGARRLTHDDAVPDAVAGGPLAAPMPVVDLAGPREVAQSRLLDGRIVLAFGGTECEAAGNVSAAAARTLVPERAGGLWHADGSPATGIPQSVAVVGTSVDGFLRDAVRRILSGPAAGAAAGCLDDARMVTTADLPAALAADVAFFERLQIPLTVTVQGLRGGAGAFSVAMVATYGRTLGVDCGGDEEAALAGAFHQALLVVQRGADPCPTHADDEKWDPHPVLDAFAAAGTPVVTGRWTGEPASALPVLLGWAGVAGVAGAGGAGSAGSQGTAGRPGSLGED